jgi:hypothetical protein
LSQILKIIAEKKFLSGIIISGIITYMLNFFELKNSDGQYLYSPVLGILTMAVLISGYYVNIAKFREIRYELKGNFKDVKISSIVFIQYCLSILINFLLLIFGLEMLGLKIMAGENPSNGIALFGMLLMLLSLVLLAYELLHFDKEWIKVKNPPKLRGSLADILLICYSSWAIGIIWSKNNFSVDILNSSIFNSIFNIFGISLLYFLLCLPVHRAYYLKLNTDKKDNNNVGLFIFANMISVVFGAILPILKF